LKKVDHAEAPHELRVVFEFVMGKAGDGVDGETGRLRKLGGSCKGLRACCERARGFGDSLRHVGLGHVVVVIVVVIPLH